MTNPKISFEGLEIEVYRSSIDGWLVVDIDSSELRKRDIHPRYAIPKLRLIVNECIEDLLPSGEWNRIPPSSRSYAQD